MAVECGLHDAALHAFPAPVDETDVVKPGLRGRSDVFVDDGRNVARREGMEVELRFDGNAVGRCRTRWSVLGLGRSR